MAAGGESAFEADFEAETAPADMDAEGAASVAGTLASTLDGASMAANASPISSGALVATLGGAIMGAEGTTALILIQETDELSDIDEQQGDVAMFQTDDGGEIVVENGVVMMNDGLETAVYNSLFGGNELDSGDQDNPYQWWGNADETQPDRKIRSRTQYILKGIPATSANLRRIEEAARNDLQWMLDTGTATEIDVEASIPQPNRLRIVMDVVAAGLERNIEFLENWKAAP